ncbi:hybrid sensor histidine kinase/response regulator [Burkholderia territorii]|uniref:Virulence sensor protein BvgS n=1 Tax=Burkholderia territorii TaxID=1503055 RepID=A0A105VIC7_9BURK|nr:sensor histidine kinase [Burkholderia territorii]KVV48325.1 hybrid sensor histidine kinase/response regulator [Burkholderia territorii]KVX41351.1 hybrid sensor histidine kinase/response regulator [Burkholderia territorii]
MPIRKLFASTTDAGAPFATIDGEARDLSLLNRYQRFTLYGGAAVLSLVILFATSILVAGSVRDYISKRRELFETHKALVQLEIDAKQASMRRAVINAELLWNSHPRHARSAVDAIVRDGHVVLAPLSNVSEIFAAATPAAATSGEIDAYVQLMERLTISVAAAERQSGMPMSGYAYSPDRGVIAITPPPSTPYRDVLARVGVPDTGALIDRLAFDVADWSNPAVARYWRDTRRIAWQAPSIDPLTGKNVFRLVEPAFEGQRHFMTFVSDLDVDVIDDRLKQAPEDAVVMLVDQGGHMLLSEDRTRESIDGGALMRHALAENAWRRGFDRFDESYLHGIFTISDRLSNSGLAIVYAYSWRTIAIAIWPTIVREFGVAALILAVLWTLVIMFDLKVLAPLFRRSRRVFDSEQMSRAIIATSPFGIALVSLDTRDVLLRNRMLELYEREAGTPPLHERLLACYQARAGGAPVCLDVELPLTLGDGRTRDLVVNFVRGRYRGKDTLLCSFSDITTRADAERALDSANRAKSTFLATISHEIRTPLNAMLGNLELLDKAPDPSRQKLRLHAVTSAARMLLDMLNNVLDMTKIEANRMTLEATSFRIDELVRDIVDLFEPIAAAKGVVLCTEIDPRIVRPYMGDPMRVRQIVVNLVSNAIKFTDRGSIALSVSAPGADATPVTIRVSDSGIGMTAAQLEHVFEPFAQADASTARRFGGTGIGLALSCKLAESMGGSIAADSVPNIGSTFVVTLPLPCDDAPGAVHTGAESDAPNLRVLFVDDNPVNRALVHDQLDVLGYRADLAANVADALELIGRNDYSVVMTDLNMPGLDGYTFARVLRERGHRAPILAVTAHVEPDEQRLALDAGIDEIVTKPTSLKSLEQAIARYTGARRETRPAPNALSSADGPLPGELHAVLSDAMQRANAAIVRALEHRDLKLARTEIHSMRGAFAMIGERDIADSCATLERFAIDGDAAAFAREFERYRREAGDALARRAATRIAAI